MANSSFRRIEVVISDLSLRIQQTRRNQSKQTRAKTRKVLTCFWLFGYKWGASRKNSTRILNTILIKNKYASQTAQKPGKNVILLIVSALALCASPGTTLGESCIGQTNWNVPSGNWFVAANWSAGVPNSGTSAQINNGGTATIGSTGAASCDLTLGGAATEFGTVVVDHGAYAITFDAAVGGYGNGVLTITNGGTVTAALAAIAAVAGSNSAATVTGTNSQWTLSGELDVGAGGTGLLTVTNSAAVTADSVHVYTSGTVTGNSTVSTTNGTTVEGTIEPSSGTLSMGGGLSLQGSATTRCNVTPQAADNVSVSGMASLDGRLSVIMTGTFTCGTTRYTLPHASGGLSGTEFASVSIRYPTNQGFVPHITYDGDYVYLDLVFNNPCG